MLVSPASVADKLSIATDAGDFLTALYAAVSQASASTLARARYPAPVEYAGRSDIFLIPATSFGHVKLRLSAGFVSVIETVVVADLAGTVYPLSPGATDLTDEAAARLLIDGERGFITIIPEDVAIRGRWVRVTHSGGLPVNSDGVYEGVPVAMREFALAQAIVALRSHRVLSKEDFGAANAIMQGAGPLLNDFSRRDPSALAPLGTLQ